MLHTILLWIAALSFAGVLLSAVVFVRGALSLPDLRKQSPRADGPLVSVVFAARDEGPHIEAALTSLLAQSYRELEFVAVDDRSDDDTGAILDRMAMRDPRIRVLHIKELPPKWLGKNHALHAGAAHASGEFILFTDADIIFERDAIARAVAFVEDNMVDHLTLGPSMTSSSALLDLVVMFFQLGFMLLFRPWLASDPKRPEHMGIGAFNLVRTSLYRAIGGHAKIPLRPDDDIRLGRVLKLGGGKQVVAGGIDVISVKWYSSVGELARGLRKNTFAAVNYSLAMAIGAVLMQLVINIWPFIAIFVTSGATRWLNLGTAVLLMLLLGGVAAGSGKKWWLMFGYPLAAVIFSYIIIAATWLTLSRGGIEWRGTFYSLKDLKGNSQ